MTGFPNDFRENASFYLRFVERAIRVSHGIRLKHWRAVGHVFNTFAIESLVDQMAADAGMDPIEFRLKNGCREGTRRVDGPVFPRIGMVETVEAIKNSAHWKSPLNGKYRGRGIATGFWFNCGLKSAATATVKR